MAAVTVNHTIRASRRARPASAAGRDALMGLSSAFVNDMSVPATVAAIGLTTTTLQGRGRGVCRRGDARCVPESTQPL